MQIQKPYTYPRALLCDMDGVLVDSEQLHWHSVLVVLQQLQNLADLPTIPLRVGWDDRRLWAEFIDTYQLSATIHTCIDLRREVANELLYTQGVPAIKGVIETLKHIKKKHSSLKLAVVSASLKDHIQASLQDFTGIFDLFISGLDDCTDNKPHAMPYLTASQHLSVPIEQCWIIEDSTPGLQAALASQAQVFALKTNYNDPLLRQQAHAQLNQFTDILNLLKNTKHL
jgi:HAD superfamily hydrolase (TIGR01509 family)